MEFLTTLDVPTAAVPCKDSAGEAVHMRGVYTATCIDATGAVKWEDKALNLVTTVGKNDILDVYLSGSGYTAVWYMGLVDGAITPTYAAGNTAASHSGWTENVTYSNATRPAPSFNAASAGAKSTTAVVFNINGSATIAGCFLINSNTKSGTTGVLLSCGSFSGGNKSVDVGDTLSITYTMSA